MRERTRRIPQVAQRAIPEPEADRVELLVDVFNAAAELRVSISIHASSEPLAPHAMRLWCEKHLVAVEERWLSVDYVGRTRLLKATTPEGCELTVFCKTIKETK